MSPQYRDQMAMTDYLIQRLENGLAGRDETDCFDKLPADRYHLGVLAPQRSTDRLLMQPDALEAEAGELPDADEIYADIGTKVKRNTPVEEEDDLSDETTTSEVEGEDSGKLDRNDLLTARGAPSAMGMEFIVVCPYDKPIRLDFEVHFAIYTRRFPTWEQQQLRIKQEADANSKSKQQSVQLGDRHVRHEIEIEPFSVEFQAGQSVLQITEPFADAIDQVLEREKRELYVWRKITRMSVPRRVFDSQASYEQYLSRLNVEVDLPPLEVYLDIRSTHLGNDRTRVGIYLVNGTQPDEQSVAANASRFVIDSQFHCHLLNGELTPIELISSPENYQYDPKVWVVGQACSVQVDLEKRLLWTESFAKYNQPRLTTKNEPPALFATLKNNPFDLLFEIHKHMLAYADEWRNKLNSGRIFVRNDAEREACQQDLDTFYDEAERFLAGIRALESDSRLLDAFKAMHRVFERVGAARRITSWRLFQLGFIVTQLPALAVRENAISSDTLDYADVLWFPTGGGKTEAYFGLISCALLYDRLRGKATGVTAWLRFPLRMLSVQQLQRAVRMLYETEQERRTLLGTEADRSDPISLGYFVGKSSTPNQLDDAPWRGKWKLSELASNAELRTQLRLVRRCPNPECDQQAVEIEVDRSKHRIKHVCQACGLDLNIFVSDDEIYRYLPSVLVGTVDKLPSVAWRKQFVHIWGGINSRCPEHGYASGQYCIVYGCKSSRVPVELYDPVPALQIQDELHLLREEFGTFSGHYETFAKTCQERIGLPPKIIAATATVEGLDRQTRHLYGLTSRRFPSRGYVLGRSFYTQYQRTENDEIEVARRYLAFKPPYLHPAEASTRVLEIVHQAVRQLYQLLEDEGPIAVSAEMDISRVLTEDEILKLLDKYDASLTYVGSKAHGSRIERVLGDEVARRVTRAGKRHIEISYLTGESTLDDIAETIDNLESESVWDDEERLDAVIGTSLISHGVDVDRFNIMVMSGMPGRTAEYIQSSSRSGRKYVGLIVVALSPWLLREQSLYHRFEAYHRHMDHMIEPVPINRFSRFAVDKTLPGILAGILNGYLAPEHRIELDKVRHVQEAMYEANKFSEDDLFEHLLDAFEVRNNLHSTSLQGALEERIKERFNIERRRLRAPGSFERVTDALSSKPMSSLRDIDEPIPFEPKEYAYSTLWWISR